MYIQTSPASQIARKPKLRPSMDLRLWFFQICGTCANSQLTIEIIPAAVESRARYDGRHVPNVCEIKTSSGVSGLQ